MSLSRFLHFRVLVPLFALPLLVAILCACDDDDDASSSSSLSVAPTVAAIPTQENLTDTSATLGGRGTNGGKNSSGAEVSISSRGIYYAKTSENADPKESGTGVTSTTASGTGNGPFSVGITGLDPETDYSFRAWATSDGGTGESEVGTFTTGKTGNVRPSVSDVSQADLTSSTVTLGGNLTSLGDSTVSERGVAFSLAEEDPDPILDGDDVTKVAGTGTGTGVFTVAVTGLEPNTEYIFKAYATNADGTGYTAWDSFTTPGTPVVRALGASDVTTTAATLSGGVTDDGGSEVTDRGVVYSLVSENAEPAINGARVGKVGEAPGAEALDEFSFEAGELQPDALYTYRAYAVSGNGVGYSGVFRFRTASTSASSTTAGTGTGNGDLTAFARFTTRLNAQTARESTTPATTVHAVEGREVWPAATQPDGKVLVGGDFTTVGGVAREGIARLNADGSLDADFVASSDLTDTPILAVQPDGKILAGIGVGSPQPIIRLNPDGSRDAGFAATKDYGYVVSVALQPDGKILLGGAFLEVNGVNRGWLTRLNRDGTLDPDFTAYGFNPATGVNSVVDGIAVQRDGKILIWGDFSNFDTPTGGVAVYHITRVNADGTLDTTFTPGSGPDGFTYVRAAALQPDGKILIGGQFTSFNSTSRNRIARLYANGSVDTTFDPGTGADGEVTSLALQADGRVLIGGKFTTVDGVPRAGVARLEANGALDPVYDPANGFGEQVNGLLLREDGRLLIVGGNYVGLTPPPRNLIQLVDNDAATQTLTTTATSATWLRGGSSPEVSDVVFELATAFGETTLGSGTRIAGGWQLTGINLTATGIVRARGRTRSGYYQSGSGLVERLVAIETSSVPLPELSSPVSSGVTAVGATLGGTIDSAGGAAITERGVFFGLRGAPGAELDTAIKAVAGGTALGAFTVEVDDLIAGREYAYAAYATSSAGTGFSEIAFFTAPGTPTIESPTSANLTDTTVTLGGDVTNDAGSAIILRGVVYGLANLLEEDRLLTYQLSLANLPKVIDPGTTGPFTVSVTGLMPETRYAFAAFAVNEYGRVATVTTKFTTTAAAPSAPEPLNGGPAGLSGTGGESGKETGSGASFAALGSPGTLDSDYDPTITVDRLVQAIAVQPDGKSLIAGSFTRVNGATHERIARLKADGLLDTTFTAGTNGPVHSVVLQPDGKILLGGLFQTVNGISRYGIARLTATGVLDEDRFFYPGSGTDNIVYSVALQPDGKILIGGLFTTVQGIDRAGVARLKANGRLDPDFDPGVGANEAVYSLAVQPDGKILVGGHFTSFGGTPRNRLVRLDSDGGVDLGFDPGTGANDRVTAVSVQPDGKILVGGYFTDFAGNTRGRLARLEANGALDTGFAIGAGADDRVYSLAMQLDGKIFVGGLFQNVDGSSRNRIARLDENGALDTTFTPGTGADGEVDAVVLEEDGSLLIGGAFSNVDGFARGGMARFGNDDATENFTLTGRSVLTWMRGGAGPVASEVAFELSTDDGATWAKLGGGTGIAGGWELGSQSLPVSGQVRAVGSTSGGFLGGSGGIVEEVLAFDYGPQLESLQAQQRSLAAKTSREKKKLKKAKQKKSKKLIQKSNKNLKKLKAQAKALAASLAAIS